MLSRDHVLFWGLAGSPSICYGTPHSQSGAMTFELFRWQSVSDKANDT